MDKKIFIGGKYYENSTSEEVIVLDIDTFTSKVRIKKLSNGESYDVDINDISPILLTESRLVKSGYSLSPMEDGVYMKDFMENYIVKLKPIKDEKSNLETNNFRLEIHDMNCLELVALLNKVKYEHELEMIKDLLIC